MKTEIQKAKEIFDRYGKQIMRDDACTNLLATYRKAIENTWSVMQDLDIIETCSSCSQKWKGGCCFGCVEEWYDDVLLFINILMGAEMPESTPMPDCCLFVGPKGCTLLARHSFCINYLCKGLKDSISQSDQKRLSIISGREILCGVQVEQSIYNWIMRNSSY